MSSRSVSGCHAEICQVDDGYLIRDLDSTNGTFVNGKEVKEHILHDGDIVHIATKEFRFGCGSLQMPECDESLIKTSPLNKNGPPLSIITTTLLLQEILHEEAVQTVLQPIVDLQTRRVVGYETLGRGTHERLSTNPAELFRIADKVGLATQLSRLFRKVAIREISALGNRLHFFFNIHPLELDNNVLVESLQQVSEGSCKDAQLVIEVHEDLVADSNKMLGLRSLTREHNIKLAFDDFGAGQSRFAELVDISPDFVKVDMKLVRDVHKCQGRQSLIKALKLVCDGVKTTIIAEGIETQEEADACLMLGCHWGQGYLFGRPMAVSDYCHPKSTIEMDLRVVMKELQRDKGPH